LGGGPVEGKENKSTRKKDRVEILSTSYMVKKNGYYLVKRYIPELQRKFTNQEAILAGAS